MSLVEIALLFARLGVVSFGGGISVIGEFQRELVDVQGIITQRQFANAFALGQATPGPGVLYMIPLGYALGGVPGAVVAILSFLTLPLLLQLVVAQQWERITRSAWLRALNRALVPASIGLIGGSLHSLGTPLIADPLNVAALVAAALAMLVLRATPPVIILGTGVLALLGVI